MALSPEEHTKAVTFFCERASEDLESSCAEFRKTPNSRNFTALERAMFCYQFFRMNPLSEKEFIEHLWTSVGIGKVMEVTHARLERKKA